MQQRRCIFHYPGPIDFNAAVGSAVRPLNMLMALRNSEYIVDEVIGYGKERKTMIKKVKENIKKGIQYDFVYSESLTIPTLLSERNHIPLFPFLDFSFFKFCKKNHIKIGLFYRDIFWKFPLYKEATSRWIPYITIPFFKYDLKKYNDLVDVIYVPSSKFAEHVGLSTRWTVLPSGGTNKTKLIEKYNEKMKKDLKLFYVGGIVALNDITELVSIVSGLEYVRLTVCCPLDVYKNNKAIYDSISGENVNYVHENGENLDKYYKDADIACLYFPNNDYRDMAMPVKLFEYIGYGKPIVSNSKTVAAEYIKEKNIGWTVDYGSGQLKKLLQNLVLNREEILYKKSNVISIAPDNTWDARVAQVIAELT